MYQRSRRSVAQSWITPTAGLGGLSGSLITSAQSSQLGTEDLALHLRSARMVLWLLSAVIRMTIIFISRSCDQFLHECFSSQMCMYQCILPVSPVHTGPCFDGISMQMKLLFPLISLRLLFIYLAPISVPNPFYLLPHPLQIHYILAMSQSPPHGELP